MPNTPYSNFFLSNEIEDQFNSHLNLVQFCQHDTTLQGTAGMTRKINVYNATDGTQKVKKGKGNTKDISVAFTTKEYAIELAQNRFPYFDEDLKEDPMIPVVGAKHMGTDMFNTVNKDIYGEFSKATLAHQTNKLDFKAFVAAVAKLNIENREDVNLFAFISVDDEAELVTNLADDLKYVEAFARTGYVGTVNGVHLYTKKDATAKTVIIATNKAVTIFVKSGTELEQERDANIRQNTLYSRKYYVVALTDESQVVKLTKA